MKRPVDKFDARRDQLAESALKTLGELGYARTTLREIANNSTFSHGVVHYYFEEQLREAVTYIDKTLEEMVWRVVTRYAELAGRSPALPPSVAYGVLDGLFQQALLAYVSGNPDVLDALVGQVRTIMPLVLAQD